MNLTTAFSVYIVAHEEIPRSSVQANTLLFKSFVPVSTDMLCFIMAQPDFGIESFTEH